MTPLLWWLLGAAALVLLAVLILARAGYFHVRTRGDWTRGLPDAALDPTADLVMAMQVQPADRTEKQQALVANAPDRLNEALAAPAPTRTPGQWALITAAQAGIELAPDDSIDRAAVQL